MNLLETSNAWFKHIEHDVSVSEYIRWDESMIQYILDVEFTVQYTEDEESIIQYIGYDKSKRNIFEMKNQRYIIFETTKLW